MRNSHKHPNTFNVFLCRTKYFKKYFYSYFINEWNKINPHILSDDDWAQEKISSPRTIKPQPAKIHFLWQLLHFF